MHKKVVCSKEIVLHAQNSVIALNSIVNVLEGPMQSFRNKIIIHFNNE